MVVSRFKGWVGKYGPDNKQIGKVVAGDRGVGGQDCSRSLAHWGGTGCFAQLIFRVGVELGLSQACS